MPAYAIAQFTGAPVIDEDTLSYWDRIDATLDAFEGRFLVHGGGDIEAVEGALDGVFVVLEFPDRERALGWYRSDAYQAILPLRAQANAIVLDGVPDGYRAEKLAASLRRAG